MMDVKKLIKLDEYTKTIPLPQLRLMTRTFEMLGNIPHYENWRVSLRGADLDEISFEVSKYYNGVLNPIWDDLVDLKIVQVIHGGKYEIQVTYTDDSQTVKSVTGVSLETELGQVALYDFHVNDDFATENDYPVTVLYDADHSEKSLIHRALADKAPHWTIDDTKIPKYNNEIYILPIEDGEPELASECQRTFTVDGTTIYDFLVGDVAKEFNIVFRFDTDQRKLWFEPLTDYYDENNNHIVNAVGEDTTILVSKRKLGNQITINSNKDNVKNCFRVEGGDDLITSQLAVVNMTGDNYIYYFADFQLEDMPDELSDAIRCYTPWKEERSIEYYGPNGYYTRYVQALERLYYLEHEMAPNVSPDPQYASSEAQWTALKQAFDTSYTGHIVVGVSSTQNYSGTAFVGISNNIQKMAELKTDPRYKVEVVKETTSYDVSTKIWTGVLRVTKESDTTEVYPPLNTTVYTEYEINIQIAEDSSTDLTYTRQKVLIALYKGDMSKVDAEFTDNTSSAEIKEFFEQWNLTKLNSFLDGYNTCMSTLMDSPSYNEFETAKALYRIYQNRYEIVKDVIDKERQPEVDAVQRVINEMIGYTDDLNIEYEGRIQQFQKSVSFMNYLMTPDANRQHSAAYTQEEANALMTKYRAYIREDTYQNSNFVSDSYEESYTDLINNAKRLFEDAEKELKKACVLQRTMTVSMNNLLALPEFSSFYSSFDLFNYIRVRTDDEVLKLRIVGIDYSGSSMESIEVTFSDQIESVDGSLSDLQSILSQARAISTSYPSTVLQASQGASAQNFVTDMVRNGLDAASTMLKNNEDNEVTITRAGIIAKRMDDEGMYDDKQLRIVGNGMYMTKDAWESVAMAVGEITVQGLNNNEPMYGVIADAIVGRFIAGNSLYIGNSNGSVSITGDGIEITNGTITWGHTTGSSVNPPNTEDIVDENDVALSTTLGNMANEIEQLDGRIETFTQALDPKSYHPDGTAKPASEWGSDADHENDIWYDTSNDVVKIYTKNGSSYSWVETNDATLKSLALEKATVFTAQPSTKDVAGYLYRKGDLWVLSADTTVGSVTYKKDTVLKAKNNNTTTTFVASDWEPATTKSAEDALTQIGDLSSNYNTFKGQVQGALTGSSTTTIGSDYIISPKIGGGYLYLVAKSGSTITGSVEINPSGSTIYDNAGDSTSGYIIKATGTITEDGVSSLATLFSIDTSGQAYFRGEINTSGGNIGGWKIRPQNIYNEYSYIYNGVTYETYSVLNPSGSFVLTEQTIGYNMELFPEYLYFVHRNTNYDPDDPDSPYRLSGCRLSFSPTDGDITGLVDDGLGEGLRIRLFDFSGSSNPFFCVCDDAYGLGTTEYLHVDKDGLVADKIKYVDTLYPSYRTSLSSPENYCCVNGNISMMGGTEYKGFTPTYPTVGGWTALLNLGTPYTRWNTIYAQTSAIDSSDRNLKNSIKPIDDPYENMFMNLEPVSYKFNNGKRTHVGFISQSVEEAMERSNLTGEDFAGFCKDLKCDIEIDDDGNMTASDPILDKKGNPEYIYSLRYSEFIALNTHMIQKLYKRIEELETEVEKLKH